jgi:type III restriction enzyme
LPPKSNFLKSEGWKEEDLVTTVDAKAVADSGLVKSAVLLGGFEAPMEETIDAMLADFASVEAEAVAQGVGLPKAIYVSKTNIVEGNSLQTDDPKQAFVHRRSPPILIWRHLVERAGVDPADIAVYSSLKTDKDYALPPEFQLFSGADKDYAAFTAGNFRHVIFNLSLQEGWDDPLCYFAYIDKSMESNVQVEQTIGRLLRQPGAKHYSDARLNSAHVYIRVDRRGVFSELIDRVNDQLKNEAPELRVIETKPGKPKPEAIRQKPSCPSSRLRMTRPKPCSQSPTCLTAWSITALTQERTFAALAAGRGFSA